MLTKDKIKKSLQNLPDSFTIDDLIEQLIFMEKVELGLLQSEQGKIISDDEVKVILDSWSK